MPKKRKPGSGGSRPNSGRKPGKPTTVISIKHDSTVIQAVRKVLTGKEIAASGRKWLDSLLPQK